MSIFEDIYNWLAQRNIGELMGLRWDPAKDKKYQRERLIRWAAGWQYTIAQAEKDLADGKVQQAGSKAYGAIRYTPDAHLPITDEVISRAKAIIARLPPGFEPPPPTTKWSADEYFAHVAEMANLLYDDRLEEAMSLLQSGEVDRETAAGDE